MNTSVLEMRDNARRGFTLIELLVVVVIIGVLVTLAVPYLNQARTKAKETQVAANLSEIHRALAAFGTDNSGTFPFRVRWFDDSTYTAAGFDPYVATDTAGGQSVTSDPASWFSLGLFGGVRVVTDAFDNNTGWPTDPVGEWIGMHEHHVVQPAGWDYSFYRVFNQYSDPLVALGYLDAYPSNPFLKGRPMGNIMWAFGDTGWDGGAGGLNKTIPHPETLPTPGDFVYTFFYSTDGVDVSDPEGVVEAKRSYQARSRSTVHDGMYYLDVVDSYQLWAYGHLPLNGGYYVAYPNNVLGLSVRGRQVARKDWDNSGTKDMYEMGMIAYFKATSTSSLATDAGGRRIEY